MSDVVWLSTPLLVDKVDVEQTMENAAEIIAREDVVEVAIALVYADGRVGTCHTDRPGPRLAGALAIAQDRVLQHLRED